MSEKGSIPFAACYCGFTISAVGSQNHRTNQPFLLEAAQVYYHNNGLFHQVVRSCTFESGKH
jgi:hypothetical protein